MVHACALNVLQVARYAAAELWWVESASLRFSGHKRLPLSTQCALPILLFSACAMVREKGGKLQESPTQAVGCPLSLAFLPTLWPLCGLPAEPPALDSDPSLLSMFSISLKGVTISDSQFSNGRLLNSFASQLLTRAQDWTSS